MLRPGAGRRIGAMSTSTVPGTHAGPAAAWAIAARSLEVMATGTLADFAAIFHPEAVNREAKDEPPAARGRGPEAFHATALWLRDAFADLAWELHDVVADGDLIALHCTMSGRHVRPMVGFDEHARVAEVFPPTGRTFATTQSHWLRVRDGLVVEHWANRDDLGTALQLGWVPPTPRYLARMALAKRRARRAARG
jgi:predicted ester cyclase